MGQNSRMWYPTIGLALLDLGGGRTHAGQSITTPSDAGWLRRVRWLMPNAFGLHPARTEADYERAADRIRNAFHFSEKAQTTAEPVVIEHRTA